MRWSLEPLWLLPSLCLILSAGACPLEHHAACDADPGNSTKALLRRVRVGGGSGGSGGTVTTTQVFLLDSGDGGCADREALLDSWLAESTELHDAITTAYADYETSLPAKILWFTFFGVVPGGDGSPDLSIPAVATAWANIGDHLARVTEFLSGSGLRNPPVPGENPRIFCSGAAGIPQDWGQAIKDKNGDEVVSEKDPDTGAPLSYLTLNEAFLAIKSMWRGSYPFWMPAFNGYAFDTHDSSTMCPGIVAGADGNDGFRAASTSKPFPMGKVDKDDIEFDLGQSNRMVLLCPEAFSPQLTHSAASLAQAVTADNYPTPGSTDQSKFLDRLVPNSATLYHEIYHLTDNSNTPDAAYSLDKVMQAGCAAGSALASTSHNPETYVYTAMAAYMLLNAPDGSTPVLYNGPGPNPVPG